MGDFWGKKRLLYGAAQHVGGRRGQEDCFGASDISLSDSKGFLSIVSDGMGGLAHGDKISAYTVSAMLSMFEMFDPEVHVAAQLSHMTAQINSRVIAEFTVDGVSGAGATLVAALILGDRLYWVSVGDSRIYLMRGGRLFQITEDHDYQNALLARYLSGDVNLRKVFSDPQKDSLASYIGAKTLRSIDVSERGFILKRGDKIVLASDGIYNGVVQAEWIPILQNKPQAAADKTIKAILAKGYPGQDNATIQVIQYN